MHQHGLKEAIYAKEYPGEYLERLRRACVRRGAGSWAGDIFCAPGSECKDYETAEKLIKHFGKEKFRAYATGGEL